MEHEELEMLIEEKVTKGEMPCGLFDTGIWVVRVFLDCEAGDTVCFEWSDRPEPITSYIDC